MKIEANMPENMDLGSMDVGEKNRTTLKNLFPGVFVETRNENGELVESIDFEKLKAELGTFSDVFEKRRDIENRKTDCGQAHFDALEVNFKVATSIHEVLTE